LRRGVLLTLVLSLLARPVLAAAFTGAAAVYYDRGHYWIELEIAPGRDLPECLADPASYTVYPLDEGSGPFSPSKVEISGDEGGYRYAVLGSSRIRGRRCYGVAFTGGGGMAGHAFDRICDPMIESPDGERTLGERIFEDWIAPAFSVSDEEYRLNRLLAAYDLEGERAVTELSIEPAIEVAGLGVTPFFTYDEGTYTDGGEEHVTRREAGVSASATTWLGGVRYRLEGRYGERRDTRSSPLSGDERSRRLSALLTVRLDNLFDGINRHGASVFKGVDIGFGWAWYDSIASGGFESEVPSPLAVARITWTLLSGLQLSYAAEVAGTDRFEGEAKTMHRFRARLLLSDTLDPGRYRAYHPDLELSVDTGRRPPFFEEERSVSLGFTFDLYPW